MTRFTQKDFDRMSKKDKLLTSEQAELFDVSDRTMRRIRRAAYSLESYLADIEDDAALRRFRTKAIPAPRPAVSQVEEYEKELAMNEEVNKHILEAARMNDVMMVCAMVVMLGVVLYLFYILVK